MARKSLTTFLVFILVSRELAEAVLPMVVTIWDNIAATIIAYETANENNGTALSAVVTGIEYCELNDCPGVGSGSGKSDENGETTLDALIADGVTQNVGAVASLRNCKQAIRAAYFVLRHTYHSVLAGNLATEFALLMGLNVGSLTTPESAINWEDWKGNSCQPNYRRNVAPNPLENCGPYYRIPYDPNDLAPPQYGLNPFVFDRSNAQISPSLDLYIVPKRDYRDSIGIICLDKSGNVAAGVSTNGANHKVPGRVSDNGVPGAAAHAANNIGAAMTTGNGDFMMSFSPANTALNYLEAGLTPAEAAQKVIDKINAWYPNVPAGIVVVDILGRIGAACSGLKEMTYTTIDDGACNTGGALVNRVVCSLH